jgi:23S rRNA pseudouridine2604 synthase
MPEELVRLSKRISELGIASRREADAWIEKGWVKVNGEIAVLGTKVRSSDRIQISSKAKAQQDKLVTVVLNKPIGYVSGQAEDGYEPAKVLVTAQNRWEKDDSPLRFHPSQLAHLVPAGRLDIDSVGLLVLTQDGRVAKSIIGENSEIEKEYIVRVTRFDGCEPKLTTEQLQLLNYGLSLDGKPLQRAKVTWLNEDELRFILKEGKKRQIRRMCEAVGLKVLRLKRVRVGNIVLGQLPLGQWRYIKPTEHF